MRIGGVPYGVGAPLLAGMERSPGVEFVSETPRILVDLLRAGKMDAALVSSIEAFRGKGYRVAPDLCIASRGPARSVRAFRRPGRIRRVGLDNGSETSVALLKILLSRERDSGFDLESCVFERIVPTAKPDELPHDLVLLIGDAGLGADAGDREVLDLGEAWHAWTGLPFVYAVWLLRPGADAPSVLPVLRRARAEAKARNVQDGTQGAIYYSFGPEEKKGLLLFFKEAAAQGLADPALEPIFLESPSHETSDPAEEGI